MLHYTEQAASIGQAFSSSCGTEPVLTPLHERMSMPYNAHEEVYGSSVLPAVTNQISMHIILFYTKKRNSSSVHNTVFVIPFHSLTAVKSLYHRLQYLHTQLSMTTLISHPWAINVQNHRLLNLCSTFLQQHQRYSGVVNRIAPKAWSGKQDCQWSQSAHQTLQGWQRRQWMELLFWLSQSSTIFL